MKISFFDIETFPILGYVWQMYEARVLKVERDWELASFAHKFAGDKTVKCVSRRLFSEKELVQKLWELIDESDIVVAQNGDEFDIKKAYAKFIEFKLPPPKPVISIDTKKIAKARFKFSSNSLAEMARLLGLKGKMDTGGFSLWDDCMKGDEQAWFKMEKYNRQDVVLLEQIYLKLRPWAKTLPTMGLDEHCPRCGSKNLKLRGVRRTLTQTFQRYQCADCGGWSSGKSAKEKLSTVKAF